MLHAIQNSTVTGHYLPASSTVTGEKTGVVRKLPNAGKPEVTAELTEKLNKLAKSRPFNALHRVKKYDPL